MRPLADNSAGGSLVVGLDRSRSSERALQAAADLAGRLGARVHVVHVVDLADQPLDPDRPDWDDEVRRRLTEERELAAHLVGERVDGWTYRLLRGDPTAALLAVADEVDALMVVVGAPRQGWGDHLLHPAARSTGQKLISRGARPVLVVPNQLPPTRARAAGSDRVDGRRSSHPVAHGAGPAGSPPAAQRVRPEAGRPPLPLGGR